MRVCIVYNQHPTGCSYYRLEMPSSRVHEMFGSEAEFVSIADVRTMSDEELRTISQVSSVARIEALSNWLGISSWSERTKQALTGAVRDPERLAILAICSPEFLVNA